MTALLYKGLIPSCELFDKARGVVMSATDECIPDAEQGTLELRRNRCKGINHEHSIVVENKYSITVGHDRQPGWLQQRWWRFQEPCVGEHAG
jgi:hypothetical protein